jgi:hypothetical protein
MGSGHGDPLGRGGEITTHRDATFNADGACRGEQFPHRRRGLIRAVEMAVVVDPTQ